jgi:ketosteroid isomerase-like protein/uncharacterized protein with GYD domain
MKKVALGAAMLLGASLTVMAADVTPEQRHEIESTTQKWADAFNNKDYRQEVSYLTDDINLVGPWGVLRGKDAALQLAEGSFAKSDAKLRDIKTESMVLHDPKTIFYTASYTLTFPSSSTKGTWLLIYQQQGDGGWKISNQVAARQTALVPTAMASSAPAPAQTGSHLFMYQFKGSLEANKAMVDNPQDRTGPNQKLLEGFGGKLLAYYVYPPGEYDGMTIVELPDEMSARALAMAVQATGAVSKLNLVPLITAPEWKTVMEKAKETKTGYTPAQQTR